MAHRVVDRLEDHFLVTEFDLQLGGMHVDVHASGIERQIHDTGRIFFGGKIGAKSLFQRRHGGFALDPPTVDKEILVVAVALDVIRATDEAADTDALVFSRNRDQPIGKIAAEHGVNGALQLSVAGGVEFNITVNDQLKGNFGMRQRHPLDGLCNRLRLGDVALEKFATGRNVGE